MKNKSHPNCIQKYQLQINSVQYTHKHTRTHTHTFVQDPLPPPLPPHTLHNNAQRNKVETVHLTHMPPWDLRTPRSPLHELAKF